MQDICPSTSQNANIHIKTLHTACLVLGGEHKLAAYLGVPTIALFGPTNPRTWGPIGRRARIIWKTKLEDISVDEVLQTLKWMI